MLHAARGGQLECMKFLHSIGAPCKYLVTLEYAVPKRYALLPGALPKLSWSDDFTIPPPANGYIDCLRFALENGCPIHEQACEHACRYNLLDCFQLLHKHGANVSFWCSIISAIMGHIEILQYLHDIGHTWNRNTIADAAEGGSLECVQYLHLHGCPWNVDAYRSAAKGGNLDCLMYLHENGCPRDKDAITEATRYGHMECVNYLILNGCPCDLQALSCIQYLIINDCFMHEYLRKMYSYLR